MRDTIVSSHRLLAVLGGTDTVSFVAVAQHFGGERHKKWTSKAGESKKQATVAIISIITSVSMEHQILI